MSGLFWVIFGYAKAEKEFEKLTRTSYKLVSAKGNKLVPAADDIAKMVDKNVKFFYNKHHLIKFVIK